MSRPARSKKIAFEDGGVIECDGGFDDLGVAACGYEAESAEGEINRLDRR
jgi:hypothetical protein